jgi:hypothetical protein
MLLSENSKTADMPLFFGMAVLLGTAGKFECITVNFLLLEQSSQEDAQSRVSIRSALECCFVII